MRKTELANIPFITKLQTKIFKTKTFSVTWRNFLKKKYHKPEKVKRSPETLGIEPLDS